MKKLLILPLLMALTACATGATLQDSAPQIEAIPAGQSRIVIYRKNFIGAAIQPVVIMDGQPTKRCQPNGVFFVNVPAGTHILSAETEVTSQVQITTTPGQTAYVRCGVGVGVIVARINLDAVPSAVGQAESAKLSLVQ